MFKELILSYIAYSDNNYFVGPSTFLVLFYADKIHSEALTVTRKHPTICYWSSEKIRYQETFEQEIGSFGLGELSEEFVNEHVEKDRYLEDSDCDKDEDDFVEFPEKESFMILKGKITNVIVEDKTESTRNLEFPSNEIGLEGINLTPLTGEKRSNEKENEDK
uniref:Uncharacterized protein n=1 Tax=Lactuca sativa TaxID=4236 RepID=A0A9R1VAQ8_LACSA|nr:hypothetical protein LSAT_V11C600313370 [Lactuca sativa]